MGLLDFLFDERGFHCRIYAALKPAIILFHLTRAEVMVRATTYSSGLLYKHVLLVLWSVLDQPGRCVEVSLAGVCQEGTGGLLTQRLRHG